MNRTTYSKIVESHRARWAARDVVTRARNAIRFRFTWSEIRERFGQESTAVLAAIKQIDAARFSKLYGARA